ncbi:MAG: hypothetical protein AB8C13_07180 [Phycisphaerales bacterium]
MSRFFSNLIDLLGGIWVLITLAVRSKFNFRSPYWMWRQSTAFPNNRVPGRRAGFIRFALEYARWAHRIRRLR